jgi:hypothetical protein
LVPILVNGVTLHRCLLDSGAHGVSFVHERVVRQHGWQTRPAEAAFTSASREVFCAKESVELQLSTRFGEVKHTFFVIDTGAEDAWLGTDVLALLGIVFAGLQAHVRRTLDPPVLKPMTDEQLPSDEQRPPIVTCGPAAPEDAKEDRENAALVRAELETRLIRNSTESTGRSSLPEAEVGLEVKSESHPVNVPQYPLPEAIHAAVDEVVEDWLRRDIIGVAAPGTMWNSPITAVPKTDESGSVVGTRVCCDLRALNKVLVAGDVYPLPDIQQLLRSFAGCTYFSMLDLEDAFLQFPLREKDQHKLSFCWRNRQFSFKRAVFGLSFMSQRFQRVMAGLFADLPDVKVFVDNLGAAGTRTGMERHGARRPGCLE